MDSNPELRVPRIVPRVLSGLEAGVLGGFVMLGLLAVSSVLARWPWWACANLFGSGFYGEAVFRLGLGKATLAGAALVLFLSGCVGGAFGALVPASVSSFRFALLAIAVGLAGYYLTASPALNAWAPLVSAHAPRPALFAAHAAYGFLLLTQRRALRRILAAWPGAATEDGTGRAAPGSPDSLR